MPIFFVIGVTNVTNCTHIRILSLAATEMECVIKKSKGTISDRKLRCVSKECDYKQDNDLRLQDFNVDSDECTFGIVKQSVCKGETKARSKREGDLIESERMKAEKEGNTGWGNVQEEMISTLVRRDKVEDSEKIKNSGTINIRDRSNTKERKIMNESLGKWKSEEGGDGKVLGDYKAMMHEKKGNGKSKGKNEVDNMTKGNSNETPRKRTSESEVKSRSKQDVKLKDWGDNIGEGMKHFESKNGKTVGKSKGKRENVSRTWRKQRVQNEEVNKKGNKGMTRTKSENSKAVGKGKGQRGDGDETWRKQGVPNKELNDEGRSRNGKRKWTA